MLQIVTQVRVNPYCDSEYSATLTHVHVKENLCCPYFIQYFYLLLEYNLTAVSTLKKVLLMIPVWVTVLVTGASFGSLLMQAVLILQNDYLDGIFCENIWIFTSFHFMFCIITSKLTQKIRFLQSFPQYSLGLGDILTQLFHSYWSVLIFSSKTKYSCFPSLWFLTF